ncbi:bifunctional 2-polyprenyl-6-hydroxyphenol methylase/3-demethylubiquinol 3-O-methyltransferase UbiG [Kordiimonas sediminis]|uniref:bifunctional 2-polyprenyl-6-hydroxyphenol methylase/3-demethylubiquinol 3-O-methyltransferase UbiG n=1 Tax=Kordiimonas sediminis TaxID=1735581 RepID=UPI0017483F0F
MATGSTVDADEVAFFAGIADSWWDPKGPFKPLHQLNPTRLAYIRQEVCRHFDLKDTLRPYETLRFLDIGCGGGLLSEPLKRLGADLVSVDASEKNIKVASLHAEQSGLDIDYRNTTAEALADAGETFDVIVNMEVIEHVADVSAYLEACRKLLKPGGIMLLSTINRTSKAYLFAIIGAEVILRWLPRGAHDWNKFLTPKELSDALEAASFTPSAPTGFSFNPLGGRWSLSDRDVAVNYAMSAAG